MRLKRKRGWHATTGVAPRKGKGSQTVEPIRNRKDVTAIMNNLKGRKDPRDYALFTIGIFTGLRASDLLSLKVKDVLNSDQTIKKTIVLKEKKTGKTRRIALSNKPQTAIKMLLDQRGPKEKTIEFLFASNQGGELTVQRLHQLVKSWTAHLDGNYGTHSLRKTFSYHLLKQGCRIDLLMNVLGHSSIATTLRYAGTTQEEIENISLKLRL